MGAYGWAWLVVAVTAVLATLALSRVARGWRWPGLRRALGWLVVVWLVLPAPVPGYPGHYAPAFLVLAFEWLFQDPGHPQTAGIILGGATAITLALLAGRSALARRRQRNTA